MNLLQLSKLNNRLRPSRGLPPPVPALRCRMGRSVPRLPRASGRVPAGCHQCSLKGLKRWRRNLRQWGSAQLLHQPAQERAGDVRRVLPLVSPPSVSWFSAHHLLKSVHPDFRIRDRKLLTEALDVTPPFLRNKQSDLGERHPAALRGLTISRTLDPRDCRGLPELADGVGTSVPKLEAHVRFSIVPLATAHG